MNRQEFEQIIGKSNIKQLIIGIFIFAFGAFIAWLVLSGADSEMDDMSIGGMIVIWILCGLCLLFGGALIWMPIKTSRQVKSGNHPILKAIDTGDRGFVVWAYEHITQVKGGGKDHFVYVFTREGKQINLSVKGKRVQEILTFIQNEFPNAFIGFSEEQQQRYKQMVKALKG